MKLLSAALALVVSLAAGLGTVSAQSQPVRILVNDIQLSVPASAQFQQGVLIAAIAPVVQAFGASAAWDPTAGTLVVRGASGTTVRLVAGQATATSGDESWALPAPPVVRDGTLVGPVASVLRRLGAYVKEDAAAGTLEATSQITDVTWHVDAGAVVVSVTATGPVRAEDRVLHDPERLVVDFTSAVIHLADPDRTIGSGPVVGMRAAQFQIHPYVTRLVFDLAHPLSDRVTTSPGIVTVVLGVDNPQTAAGSREDPPPGVGSVGADDPDAGVAPAAAPSAADQPPPLRDSRPPTPTVAWTPPASPPPLGDSPPPRRSRRRRRDHRRRWGTRLRPRRSRRRRRRHCRRLGTRGLRFQASTRYRRHRRHRCKTHARPSPPEDRSVRGSRRRACAGDHPDAGRVRVRRARGGRPSRGGRLSRSRFPRCRSLPTGRARST